jgi:hypothetical protein
MQRFRHGSWMVDNYLYIFGGFEHESPNVPTETVTRINILKAFQPFDNIYQKTQYLMSNNKENEKKTTSANVSANTSFDKELISTNAHSANTSYDFGKGNSPSNVSNNNNNSYNMGLSGGNNVTLKPQN